MSLPLQAGSGRLPSLVVLGAPRAGTTSLAAYLTAAGMGVGVKDSFYLMDDDAGLRGPTHVTTHGVPGYVDLFRAGSEPTVEVSAGYLYQDRALEFFSAWQTPPTFAVIVRDPVERLRSVHRYFAGNLGVLPADLSFTEYVTDLRQGRVAAPDKTVADALNQGDYVRHIMPWVEAFGRARVAVLNFEEIERHPGTVTSRLAAMAGGRPSPTLEEYQFKPRNQSFTSRSHSLSIITRVGRRLMPDGRARAWGGEQLRRLQVRGSKGGKRPSIEVCDDDATVSELAEFYAPSNAKLASVFGVDVSRWT